MQWFKRAVLVVALVGMVLAVRPMILDAYAPCNCTAYAHSRRPDLPMTLGNARTWGVRARAAGYVVDGHPRVGDIMVLQPGVQGASWYYGHVAYVTAVSGNIVTVREMNGGDSSCRVARDQFHTGWGVQFIHRPSYRSVASVQTSYVSHASHSASAQKKSGAHTVATTHRHGQQ